MTEELMYPVEYIKAALEGRRVIGEKLDALREAGKSKTRDFYVLSEEYQGVESNLSLDVVEIATALIDSLAKIAELETENAALKAAASARARDEFAHGYTPLNRNDSHRLIGED